MLVYGDRSRSVHPRAYVETLAGRWRAAWAQGAGLARHARLVGLAIDAGKLVQGVADAAFEAAGHDTFAWDAPHAALAQITECAAASWRGGRDQDGARAAQALQALRLYSLPESVTLKEPEGYAFYAVYPELYLEGARSLSRTQGSPAVIGLRSIGTSLAAMASCGANARPPVSLRPVGDPCARQVKPDDAMRERLLRESRDGVIVVDEGPGASGSSFGAIGDLLEDAGAPAESITYMPSHLGALCPQAGERHRARWRAAKKAYASFDDVILPRLPGWIEPMIGPLTQPLRDLSGGLWREALGVQAPAWPEQERRKYLAVTERGRFLLKFAGLGEVGPRKLARGQALASGGFTAAPVGLAHGFLVEPFLEEPLLPEGAPLSAGDEVEVLGRYLGFRARELTPPHGAADDGLLRTMMRRNLGLAGLPAPAEQAATILAGERGPPCAVDGRLHAWEWRRRDDGRLIKLDALDHCEAHDLIGAQDLAWDVAGAAVEHDLDGKAAERLRRIVAAEAGYDLDPRRIAFQGLAYLAFQIGWWTLAGQGGGGAQAASRAAFYEDHARRWRPA